MVVSFASAINAPLPTLPPQTLILNLLTHVFPAPAAGVVEGSADVMRNPPRDLREPTLEGAAEPRREDLEWHECLFRGLSGSDGCNGNAGTVMLKIVLTGLTAGLVLERWRGCRSAVGEGGNHVW
jgi:hypothetical protein